ncbi:MAG TPA: polysaccharide biosynthesis C-terminal domain-containing protein [Methylomirabilota bacterium]|nr:polysaccharide biosynthesis C-terminal domain-containing protein [Methylomirabilota bacterium]
MNVHGALMRNTFWYGLVTALGLLSGLLMSIILARGLGPALMGDLSYLLWFERTLTAVAMLGYGFATVRYTAEAFARDEDEHAWGVVRLYMRRQALTTAIVVVAVLPLVLWLVPGAIRGAFLVILAQLFLVTTESLYSYALQGAQRYDLTTRTSAIKMALQLVVAALAILYGADLLVLVSGLALTLTVSCLIQRRRAHEVYHASLRAPVAPMTAEARAYLLPLSVVAVLDAIVWDRSEVFFLGLYASSEDIAFYSLAFGLATRIMIIPGIVVGALLPAFSTLHGRGHPEEFRRLYRMALRYVGLVGVPLAAIVAALAPGLIVWLYGEAYLPAARLMGVMAAVSLLSALRSVTWAALRAVGDRRCALTATAVAAVVNIALAAALIPRWTTTGAVIANTAAQVTASVWVFIGFARAHRASTPLADFAKLAAAGALTLLVTDLIAGDSHELMRLVVAGAAGFTVFALACLPTRLLGPREWTFITTSTRRLAARASGATTA